MLDFRGDRAGAFHGVSGAARTGQGEGLGKHSNYRRFTTSAHVVPQRDEVRWLLLTQCLGGIDVCCSSRRCVAVGYGESVPPDPLALLALLALFAPPAACHASFWRLT